MSRSDDPQNDGLEVKTEWRAGDRTIAWTNLWSMILADVLAELNDHQDHSKGTPVEDLKGGWNGD